MKVQVQGQAPDPFLKLLDNLGFVRVESEPEAIIAYGGDGTFIGSERVAPGVPKLGIRSDATCRKCEVHRDDHFLRRLQRRELPETELVKLSGRFLGTEVLALNDIIVRNGDPRSAVRFRVAIDGEAQSEEMIGDGLVVCTAFGSSAYFRSITRCVLRVGFGVAFNNCTDPLNHLVISERSRVEVEITRGPGILAADNDDRTHQLHSGTKVLIERASAPARVIGIDSLRCPDCRYVNAPRRRY